MNRALSFLVKHKLITTTSVLWLTTFIWAMIDLLLSSHPSDIVIVIFCSLIVSFMSLACFIIYKKKNDFNSEDFNLWKTIDAYVLELEASNTSKKGIDKKNEVLQKVKSTLTSYVPTTKIAQLIELRVAELNKVLKAKKDEPKN